MTIQPLARLKSTAPAAGRHEQRVVLKGEYRGGPRIRNGPPRPVQAYKVKSYSEFRVYIMAGGA